MASLKVDQKGIKRTLQENTKKNMRQHKHCLFLSTAFFFFKLLKMSLKKVQKLLVKIKSNKFVI